MSAGPRAWPTPRVESCRQALAAFGDAAAASTVACLKIPYTCTSLGLATTHSILMVFQPSVLCNGWPLDSAIEKNSLSRDLSEDSVGRASRRSLTQKLHRNRGSALGPPLGSRMLAPSGSSGENVGSGATEATSGSSGEATATE